MALFRRNYDDMYSSDYRSDRSPWSTSGTPMRSGYEHDYGGQNAANRSFTSWNSDRYHPAYGEEYRTREFGRDYDQGYKSRWQTDYGDPYGDRRYHTPMRVIRGSAHGYDRTPRYGRDYNAGYPFGYLPYSARAGYDSGYNRRFPQYGGYDRGWF